MAKMRALTLKTQMSIDGDLERLRLVSGGSTG